MPSKPRRPRARSRRSQTESDASEESRFHFAIDIDGDLAVFTLDSAGKIDTWNSAAERITGYPASEIIGQSLSVLYPPSSAAQATPSDLIARAVATGRAYYEGWHACKNGTRFWASVLITAQRRSGDLAGFAAVTHDLSTRLLIEERLRSSEQRLQLMIDSIQDYAILRLSPMGEVTSWNRGAERITDYSADEIIGQHFSIFYPPESRAAGMPVRMLEAAARHGRVEAEGWRIRRDGSRFWADVIISPIRDETGGLQGYTKVMRDLTQRKRLEELEHLSEMSAATERAREDEKKRVARELHDDLGQQLTALKMGAARLHGAIVSGHCTPDAAAMANGLLVQIDETLTALRRIASDLRPTLLDDLGLLPAVEWLAEEFGRRFGIKVCTELSAAELAFGDAAATAIFRIVQEALTNVARHAHASAVTVRIALVADQCEIVVEDNGSGVPPDAMEAPQSFGLVGICERARQFNGTVSTGPAAAGGFCLCVRLPVELIVRR